MLPIAGEIKPTKCSKQVARKRKRESPSREASSSSAHESGKRNKRATRACERCRNKKIKCDIERDIACNACVDANVICEAGNGKHTEDKKYPPGYTESLENTYLAMVLVIDKLWRMVKNRESWTGDEPRMKDGGKGPVVIHDLALALGCIRNAPGLPETFVEDAPALYTKLAAEELSKAKHELMSDSSMSTNEAAPILKFNTPKRERSLKVESPVERSSSSPLRNWIPPAKPSIQLQFKSSNNSPLQARLSGMEPRPDTSRVTHEPSFESLNTTKPNIGSERMKEKIEFMTKALNVKRSGAVNSRRAPGLTIQPQPYNFKEQSASSKASPFSPIYQNHSPSFPKNSPKSPFQSTVSSYQADSPASLFSGLSYEMDSPLSSAGYQDNFQNDSCFLESSESLLFPGSMFPFDTGFYDASFPSLDDDTYASAVLFAQ